jgi:leucyl/phenylalanyl-tRNA--protein transferase
MFSRQSNASKMALAALVAFCRAQQIPLIDCQQDTPHLASLGAALMPRPTFLQHVQKATQHAAPSWKFEPIYWQNLFGEHSPSA